MNKIVDSILFFIFYFSTTMVSFYGVFMKGFSPAFLGVPILLSVIYSIMYVTINNIEKS